jgi:stage V sporulation protein D (sporulation-specific penicillin-binding protein)
MYLRISKDISGQSARKGRSIELRGREDDRRAFDERLVQEKMRQERRLKKSHSHRQKPGASSYPGAGGRASGHAPASRRSRRLGVVALCVVLVAFSGYLIYQLYEIQIVNYAVNAEKAAGQHYERVTENPKRGSILDRNGVELAGTTYVYRIGITPKDMRSRTKNVSKDEIAAGIASSLGLEKANVLAEMAKEDASYIQLKKDVPREEADKLKVFLNENTIGGVRIDSEPCRYYTNGSLASQVIGYTIYSDQKLTGQLGAELQYDSALTGEPGYTYVETDNYGSYGQLPFSVPTSLRAKDGLNVVLSIDINIQKIAQEELQNAIDINEITSGGSVIIMNPYTGEILAMASFPYFDSSDPMARPADRDEETWKNGTDKENIEHLSKTIWRNKAISDTYEPGSTFKAITASMALEENLTRESEDMNCTILHLYDWTIRCHQAGGHGKETMEQGFWRSCNPIFATLALRVGVSRFYDYVRAYGLAGITGIDLPGEMAGIIHQNPTELDMATFSYGESSTVTPIQLITAYCVFANGGSLIRPTVVKMLTDSSGDIVREIQPETIRKVISEPTASRIRELMKGVVLYGTGSAAYVEGYAVAGKTSTSTDEDGNHTLSFAGLAPADNPEIVVMIVLNKPKDKELTSKCASLACGKIISRTLEYLGVSREYSDKDITNLNKTITVPDLKGQTFDEARKALSALGLSAVSGDLSMGGSSKIKFQWPAAETKLHKQGVVYLYPVGDPEEELVIVPDFKGRNINECLRLAAESGLNISFSGSCLGAVVSQDPAPTFSGAEPSPTPSPSETSPEQGTGTTEPDETAAPQAIRLVRGSIVYVTFAEIEERIIQPDETE